MNHELNNKTLTINLQKDSSAEESDLRPGYSNYI